MTTVTAQTLYKRCGESRGRGDLRKMA